MDSKEAVFSGVPAIRQVAAVGGKTWWNLHLPPQAVPCCLDEQRGRRWTIALLRSFDEARGVAAYLTTLRFYELTKAALGIDAARRWADQLPLLCPACDLCWDHCDCNIDHNDLDEGLWSATDFYLGLELCDECWPHSRVLRVEGNRLLLIELDQGEGVNDAP